MIAPYLYGVLFVAGTWYFLFYLLRSYLSGHAKSLTARAPWSIFVRYWAGLAGLVMVFSAANYAFLQTEQGWAAVIPLATNLAGYALMLVDIARFLVRCGTLPPEEKTETRPPLGLRITDACAGVFVFGSTYFILGISAQYSGMGLSVGASVIGLYLAFELVGFCIALDVMRRTDRFRHTLSRTSFIVGLMAYSSVLMPLAYLSWRGWLSSIGGSDKNLEESRGAHQRLDFPETDDAKWNKHVTLNRKEFE